jgi:hypothetical protein
MPEDSFLGIDGTCGILGERNCPVANVIALTMRVTSYEYLERN